MPLLARKAPRAQPGAAAVGVLSCPGRGLPALACWPDYCLGQTPCDRLSVLHRLAELSAPWPCWPSWRCSGWPASSPWSSSPGARKDCRLGWTPGPAAALRWSLAVLAVYAVTNIAGSQTPDRLVIAWLLPGFLPACRWPSCCALAAPALSRPLACCLALPGVGAFLAGWPAASSLAMHAGGSAIARLAMDDGDGVQEMRHAGSPADGSAGAMARPAADSGRQCRKAAEGREPPQPQPSRPACASTSPRPCSGCPMPSPTRTARLHLDVPVADSITTWRITALASTPGRAAGLATAPAARLPGFLHRPRPAARADRRRRGRRAGGRLQLPARGADRAPGAGAGRLVRAAG